MNRAYKRLRKNLKKGLTLVELAVVIMIMGLIITIVAFNISPGELKDDAAVLKLKKDAQELQMHLERYAARYGSYPTEEQGLRALVERPTSGDVPDSWRPIIKNKSAIEDPWKTEYVLKIDEQTGNPVIITLGKDKKEGGEGKNSDFNILQEDRYPKGFKK